MQFSTQLHAYIGREFNRFLVIPPHCPASETPLRKPKPQTPKVPREKSLLK